MKIAIGTLNPAKINPTKKVLSNFFSDVEFVGINVSSNVSEMPLTNEEMIEGAINRAKNALKKIDADYGVGLEGGVYNTNYGMFLAGWVAIINKDGKIGLGSGPRMLLPNKVKKAMLKGEELGPYLEKNYPEVGEIRRKNGAYGLFSDNLVTRPENFDIAIRCAFTPFINNLYNND